MRTLAIDTSTNVMGVAVLDDNTVIGEVITNINKNHSLRLMPAISDLLAEIGILAKDLDRIVVAKGPGSYTGVRIGVTIAKTMAWSLNIPLVGVSSLEMLAQNGRYFEGCICPIFDARRGLVFTGLYESQNYNIVNIIADQNVLLTDWLQVVKDKGKEVLFVGNDVALHKEIIELKLGALAKFANYTSNNQRPSELGLIGLNKEPDDIHTFVPSYIRMAEAEANWLANQKKTE